MVLSERLREKERLDGKTITEHIKQLILNMPLHWLSTYGMLHCAVTFCAWQGTNLILQSMQNLMHYNYLTQNELFWHQKTMPPIGFHHIIAMERWDNMYQLCYSNVRLYFSVYSSGQPKPTTFIVAEWLVEIVQFRRIIISFAKWVDCTFFRIF